MVDGVASTLTAAGTWYPQNITRLIYGFGYCNVENIYWVGKIKKGVLLLLFLLLAVYLLPKIKTISTYRWGEIQAEQVWSAFSDLQQSICGY